MKRCEECGSPRSFRALVHPLFRSSFARPERLLGKPVCSIAHPTLSLSHTRTLFPFRATRANTCEDNPCVRNVRVSNPRPPRCLVTMLQLIHDSSGYRLPSKADTFNPEFNLLSLYFSLSPSQMRSTYAKIYRSITVHDRERCC